MANKKSKKKKVTTPESNTSASTQAAAQPKKADSKKAAKNDVTSTKKLAKEKKNKKPGFFARVKNYFASVRSEMKRVVWPTKQELINYTVAVCASLIVVGVVIAVFDAVIGQGLVLFSGLRSW